MLVILSYGKTAIGSAVKSVATALTLRRANLYLAMQMLIHTLALTLCFCDFANATPINSSPRIVPQLAHSFTIVDVAFSPDGKQMLSAGGTELILWDVENGYELRRFRGHAEEIAAIAISSDGKTAASGGKDGVLVWDLETGETTRRIGAEAGAVTALAFHPSGTLFSGHKSRFILWNLSNGDIEYDYSGHSRCVNHISLSLDGKIGMAGCIYSYREDHEIIIWNLENRQKLKFPLKIPRQVIETRSGSRFDPPLITFELSPNGQFGFLTLNLLHTHLVLVWNIETGKKIVERERVAWPYRKNCQIHG